MSRQTKMNLLSVAALSLLVFVAAGTTKKKTNSNSSSDSRPATSSSSSDSISAEDLYAEFDSDREAASSKYKGKTITVNGRVDKISTGSSGNSYVILKSSSSIFGVQCIFDGSSSLSGQREGDRVTLRGEFFAKIGNVVLRRCESQ